ncbi:ATP-binding protein [Nocardioides currus]|uniref:Transcriptional regulator n=1 Tax=Nocardioides currus TaxID=2133958 RepID=A0A2R7YTQ5_9ACTN|nr:BTAD domain-containing putative transcriptional regulator [Nocardioides currus]PUA79229.1 transcriptional regulator [Nocardioides currus]
MTELHAPALRLLDGVSWQGEAIPGDRLKSLLAALALEPSGVSDAGLAARVWADDEPAHPTKALQVLVSRIRSRTQASVPVRHDGGYRLGLAVADVDAWTLTRRVTDARAALAAGDPAAALDLVDVVSGWSVSTVDSGPLADLRARARADLADALRTRGVALSRTGRHDEAAPVLATVAATAGDDVEVREAWLRSQAATAGAATALSSYEAFREDLADRLGVDPDPTLQRLHAELLAADAPVRSGVRHDVGDTGGLLGRDADLERLRTSMASGRLTTILGPGGIGKTSAAQLLAAESTVPRVHVVELVGVGAGDDVVAAVGAALGVRGSFTTRHALTAAQQSDVRGRLAQELDAAPALLVLDNCEHVLEPVAALVAFLLATTRDLRVLTTSRAPLRLAAERVVPLSQLADPDAEQLFVRRALAVRPDAAVDADTVRAVVSRLDGLPLAVELAAARVRTMTVAEVAAALSDRFATLRTRDRNAPDRHRTLEAVIGWSWDLLAADERRALAWLSVFQDGFDRATAAAVLGPDGLDLVDGLVEQSLLVLTEDAGTTRLRALETIREFAAKQLASTGEHDDAVRAQQRWATDLSQRCHDLVVADDQVELVDLLVREQNNLTDVLRHALAVGDRELVARLVSLLGSLWTITGDQPRIFAICDPAFELMTGWDVPAELLRPAQEAAGALMVHLSWMPGVDLDGLRDLLLQGDVPTGTWGLIGHTVYVADEPADPAARVALVADAQDDPVRAGALLMWAAILSENDGDVDSARTYAARALAAGTLTPYLLASVHAELSQLAMAVGDHRSAAHHASIAWPMLLQVHSVTDAYSLRVATAISPLLDGEVDRAEAMLEEFGEPDGETAQMGARLTWHAAQAELALARGDFAGAVRRYDSIVGMVLEADPAGGVNPWLMLSASAALVSRARFGERDVDARADELRDVLVGAGGELLDGRLWFTDLPLDGVLMVALAAWVLRYGPAEQHEDGVLLLAIAQRWAYNRSIPVMSWEPMVGLADAALPGRVDQLLDELADRAGLALLPDATAAVGRLRRAWQ